MHCVVLLYLYISYVAGFVGTGGLGDWGLRTSEAATTAGLHKISAKSLIVCMYVHIPILP